MNLVSVVPTQEIRAGTHDFLIAEAANYSQTMKVTIMILKKTSS